MEFFPFLQADFATSAVDFLHRVGRTARAGRFGVITSLYTQSNRDLVDAVRQAGKLGQPLVNFCSFQLSIWITWVPALRITTKICLGHRKWLSAGKEALEISSRSEVNILNLYASVFLIPSS